MNILTPCIKSTVALARVTAMTAVPRVAIGGGTGATGGATAIPATWWQGLRLTGGTRTFYSHFLLSYIHCSLNQQSLLVQ